MAGDELDDGLDFQVDYSSEDEEILQTENQKPQDSDSDEEQSNNKRKRNKNDKNKFQEKKKAKMQIDVDRKKFIAKESSTDSIADYINETLRRKNPDLSALELAELYFKKTDFRSTSEFDHPRTLDNLSKFILGRFDNMLPSSTPGKKNSKKLKESRSKRSKDGINGSDGSNGSNGSKEERKFLTILSMSALRACDVHRSLREIPGSSLKLINKNKLAVDLKLVLSTWSRVLCCTPGRLEKVLASEELPLNRQEIKIVIVDASYLDQKMQNVFSVNETLAVLKALTASGAKIYLY